MDVREATRDDGERIRTIARRSLESSYPFESETVERAVDSWYGPEAFEDKLADQDVIILVVETDEVVAFSENHRVPRRGQADLLWLHVHPDHRNQGIGSELFEATCSRLREEGAEYVRGRVLAENESGGAFYEHHGFEHVGRERITIDGEVYDEEIYVLLDVE